jgi:hypothetical protein
LDSLRRETCCNLAGFVQDIGVTVCLDPAGLIQRECETLGESIRPALDLLKYPSLNGNFDKGWA